MCLSARDHSSGGLWPLLLSDDMCLDLTATPIQSIIGGIPLPVLADPVFPSQSGPPSGAQSGSAFRTARVAGRIMQRTAIIVISLALLTAIAVGRSSAAWRAAAPARS
jgi:hypothetical protein